MTNGDAIKAASSPSPRARTGHRQRAARPEPHREALADWLAEHPQVGLSSDEVRAHFECIPPPYWERVTKEDVVWHLNASHNFFQKLAASNSADSPVAVDWVNAPGRDCTRVICCSWDRPRLLEHLAAAFSALRITILRADVYTRTDSLALDVFEVCEPNGGPVADVDRLNGLAFLVEGAFSHPPRFASLWSTQFHKALPRPAATAFKLSFDNRKSREHTILHVEAPDRLGLLYDLLHALAGHGLNIRQAIIKTEEGIARDEFHFTDGEGRKTTSAAQLKQFREVLTEAITS